MHLIRDLLGRLTWRLGLLWLTLVGTLWLYIEFADRVIEGGAFPFDEAVMNWFYQVRTPLAGDIMYAVSVAGDVPITIGVSALILALLRWRLRREAGFFLLAVGGAALIMVATKFGLGRARPDLFPDAIAYATASPSFPSGHATGAAALWTTLWLIARRHLSRGAWTVGVVGLLVTLTIAASRLYLQVHYPSDIVAGLALGAGWVVGVHAIYHRDRSRRFMLVSLPRSLDRRVHDEAERRGRDIDAMVAEWLEAGLEREGSGEARDRERVAD